MIRLGAHWVEPRRLGFFAGEALVLLGVFVGVVATVARIVGAPLAPSVLLIAGVFLVGVVELGLHLGDLHDLRIALGDAARGARTWRALGTALVLVGLALGIGLAAIAPAVSSVPAGQAGHLGHVRLSAPALLAGLGAVVLTEVALRGCLPAIDRRLALRPRLFLVGEGRAARTLVREIQRDGTAEVVGFAGPRTRDLATRARAAGAEMVVVAADRLDAATANAELLGCRAAGLEVVGAATLATRVLHRLPVDLVQPVDLIFADGFHHPRWLRLARRALSVTASLVLLALSAPLCLLAALAIKLDSPGPVIYRQERVGCGGRLFRMLKFRTMRPDAEAGGARWAAQDDPRVTRVGRVLRRYRIDELPQLVNVLRGEMELVGPRPERETFVRQLREKLPYYDLRHLVPPGVTGYAQVLYPYASSIEETREKLQYDLYYVRHLSLGLDLYVLAMTARVVLFGRGAR